MKLDLKKLFMLLMIAALNGKAQWFTTGNIPTGTDYLGLNQPADLIFKTSVTAGSPLERLRITSTGSIGIGNVTSPQHFMDISVPGSHLVGERLFNIGVSDAGSDFFRIMNGTSSDNQFMPLLVGHNNTNPAATGLYVCGSINSSYDLPVYSEPVINFNARRNFPTSGGSAVSSRPLFCWSNYTTKYMTMLANGYLGINTTVPSTNLTVNGKVLVGDPNLSGFTGINTTGQYLLYVQQGILTEKVKVAIATSSNWADYVFERSYKLRSLQELEKYIIDNKHLPNIPSADEVVQKGVDLAIMNAKLLEKIEELSLYIIQLNKRIEKLEK